MQCFEIFLTCYENWSEGVNGQLWDLNKSVSEYQKNYKHSKYNIRSQLFVFTYLRYEYSIYKENAFEAN